MTSQAETVLGQILRILIRILRYLVLGVGYVISMLGAGISWLGQWFLKLSGMAKARKHQRQERPVEPTKSEHTKREKQSEEAQSAVAVPASRVKEVPEIDIPTTRAEILAVIESAPYVVFSKDERHLMEAVLTLKERPVREIMLKKDKIVYVESKELLGPVALDRLYRSKLLHFPVKNAKGEVIGAIHTASLNSLEVKESFRAGEILDPNVYYIREDYTLAEALDTFLRNSCYFCLVVNNYGKTVGMVTLDDLVRVIFGELKIDDFKRDDDPLAVAKRRFPVEIE